MSDQITTFEVGASSDEFATALRMADAMRDAVVALDVDWADPQNHSFALTGAAIFAGTLFGQMVALGLCRPQDQRRAGELVLKNFRSGATAGRRVVARMSSDQSAGGMVQ